MARLQPVTEASASADASDILSMVRDKMGVVPNLIATMVNSPAVTTAYLAFSQALAGGSLSASLREQIALTVAETNQCEYCLAAHSLLGKNAGLDEQQIIAARRANANDSKQAAVLKFVQALVTQQGQVNDTQVQELRDAGFSDGDITEIVANVILNIFTNYFNHVADTDIDFPLAPELPE